MAGSVLMHRTGNGPRAFATAGTCLNFAVNFLHDFPGRADLSIDSVTPPDGYLWVTAEWLEFCVS